MTLEPFDAARTCPKCGSLDIYTRHMEQVEFRYHESCSWRERREHMHRYCRGCGYPWDEAPLDAGKETKP